MKQNERLLVYAVTGFLALILVVAVLFSREPAADSSTKKATQGLADILGEDGKVAAEAKSAKEKAALEGNKTGLPAPGELSSPLAAPAPKPMLAADLVAQQLGLSRRDRMVRFVRAKQNDSLDVLVRRWCGARDPYFAEAKSLNEDLVVLRVGQEVAVPWVDDEVLLASIEASKPKTLLAQDAVAGGTNPAGGSFADASTGTGSGIGTGTGTETTKAPAASPAPVAQPAFRQPGDSASGAGGKAPALAAGTSYTVKDKDSLWRIAERTYGKKNAPKMVQAIKDANPGLGDDLKVGQKITLPAASGA